MGKKQQNPNADPLPEPNKKRRVWFSRIDAGVDPNDCIKIYLVSKKEEVGTSDGFCIDPVDLNCFFEEDEKIYGYQGLKITVWVSSISFHAHADISFQCTSGGGKGITDLKSALEKFFGDTLLENKDDFLQTFSTENNFVSSVVSHGEELQTKASSGHITHFNGNSDAASSDLEVVRLKIDNLAAGHLYSRLVPLILVLPPYQHKGYGSHLLEALSNVAISENVYDLTVEEPLDYFQHVRTSFDIKRLIAFEPAQDAVKSAVSRLKQGKMSKKPHIPRFLPPPDIVEEVRKTLKINKKQFLKCWEILIYLGLDPMEKHMEDYVTVISNRMKTDILGKDSQTAGKQVIEVPSVNDEETSFVMFRSRNGEVGGIQMDEDQAKTQEQQLQQSVDERIKEVKLIAEKVSQKHV
ncbi:histone acetyltransferase type B catalytic subunit-like isoform X2 [Hibiscus syriacus]|uniref:histone acetyltransferase n=1 Tax=Hibiscus syriacus TaxID=106335 RepID=A0A6A3ASL0_HIBSY|nr:histone acetyltransferase type B catalytic subunit-like isoform X2 [Hibiscus syriacus]